MTTASTRLVVLGTDTASAAPIAVTPTTLRHVFPVPSTGKVLGRLQLDSTRKRTQTQINARKLTIAIDAWAISACKCDCVLRVKPSSQCSARRCAAFCYVALCSYELL